MAATQFKIGLESIILGLLNDAQSDEAYDYVMPFHTEFTKTSETKPAEFFQMSFIAAVRNQAEARNCIRTHDLGKLEAILLYELPDSLGGAVKEVCLSVGVPELFRSDTLKKFWKRVKKLVHTSGLGSFVYDDEKIKEHEEQHKQEEHSVIVEARINRFNHGYREFLQQLSLAFPKEEDMRVIEVFDEMVAQNSTSVISEFKKQVLPLVPRIAKAVQDKEPGGGVTKVLAEYFGSDCTWFSQLPLLNHLSIQEYWAEQIANTENKNIIMKALGDLTLCMSGIDTLIYSPIVSALKNKAIQIMTREKLSSGALTPGSENFSKAGAMNLVMELVQEIPAATDYRITSADIEKLVCNTLAGKEDVPDSFSEVFSPDMIDMDCIEAVSEMEGIGDALGPFMAGFESQLKGHVGTPAFGAVQTPGWMSRE